MWQVTGDMHTVTFLNMRRCMTAEQSTERKMQMITFIRPLSTDGEAKTYVGVSLNCNIKVQVVEVVPAHLAFHLRRKTFADAKTGHISDSSKQVVT